MLWTMYRKEIDQKVRSHWTTFNKQRLDWADGTLPENNPVNFYFYCDLDFKDEDTSEVKVKFRPVHDVDLAEAAFYDGMVYCDGSGQVHIQWESDRAESDSLMAMATQLEDSEFLSVEHRYASYDADEVAA